VRRSLDQDVRRLERRRADRPAGRYRVAQEGQARACRGRRVLQQLPRLHGLGLLLEQSGRAGPGLHGEHLRRRMEGLPAGGAGQARSALRRLTGNGKGETGKVAGSKRLGVGFVGSGFNARFHLQGLQAVRDADVLGVWSPNGKHAEDMAAQARRLDLGPAKAHRSIAEMVADPGIDAPWFWRGDLQGGGVLSDMMCHSSLVVRHLLTKPGAPLATVRPVRVTGHIGSLKWSRPAYAKQLQQRMGKEVDYAKRPSEDFASVLIEFTTDDGATVLGEATTSWSFVGAGLRLSAELLGPEYSMSWNSLESPLRLFFSREVKGQSGEDLVEKQNAGMGLMPVISGEAAGDGYEAGDRHFVRVFLGREQPQLTFDDGVEVVKLLMTAYMSAEQGKTVEFPPKGLETFVPAVAKGTWKP